MGRPKTEKEREILENIIKAEMDFITYVDVDTREANTIHVNDNLCDTPPLYGDYDISCREMLEKYIHMDDHILCERELNLTNMQQKLNEKGHMVITFRFLEGIYYRWKEISISYYKADKSTIVMVMRDVTDSYEVQQKQKEHLYYALMDARHANQEKNEFLERMSHEIRTPMNSIIGLSYLTSENAGNEKQVLENLNKINVSAQFLLSFINDILNLSQIESGNIALIQEDVELEVFLDDLAKETMRAAENKGIQLNYQKRSSFYEEYTFDAKKMKKAIHNILDNAVKFTPIGGTIDFVVEKLPSNNASQDMVRMEIRDNGIGIEEEFLPYIFEPFEQEKYSNTTLSGGTGLGLAITRNIIEFMGGHIEAYSEKGVGTTFVITMTFEKVVNHEEAIRKHDKSERMDYDFSGKRALLVEDNEINIEITKNILLHKKLEVEVATNGEEGLNCYLEHEPGYYDVILMDIRMPVMDGLTATRNIRESKREDCKNIPIIAMTANVFEEDVRKSFEAGMDAHLSKPLDIKQMYFVLDSMING